MKRIVSLSVTLAFCGSLLLGCASQRQTEQLGGFVIGAVIGGLAAAIASDDELEAVPVGAAAGGLVGWAIMAGVQYGTRQASVDEESGSMVASAGGLEATVVKIARATSAPETVVPGGTLAISTGYSVDPAPGDFSVEVEESWVLRKDGLDLVVLEKSGVLRTKGSWVAEPTLTVPESAAPGAYEVEHRVVAGTSYDVVSSAFLIAG